MQRILALIGNMLMDTCRTFGRFAAPVTSLLILCKLLLRPCETLHAFAVGFGMVCGMPLTIRREVGQTHIQANSCLRRRQRLWLNPTDPPVHHYRSGVMP
jgi:hypothetical protein